MSSRFLNRLCSTSSCCSPATSMASMLKSVKRSKLSYDSRALESRAVMGKIYLEEELDWGMRMTWQLLQDLRPEVYIQGFNSHSQSGTHRHKACVGKEHRC